MTTQPCCPAVDVHTHIHPALAEAMLAAMTASGIEGIVNLGVLEACGVPFEEGMAVFRKVFGERMVYFTTPDFRDTSPGFGERMAADLARKIAAGARGLKIFKELGLRHKDSEGRLIAVDDPRLDPLWEAAGRLGAPALIHTADPLAFFRPLDEANERWDELHAHPDWHFGRPEFPDHDALLAQRNRLLERHPRTVFIGAHLSEYPENLAYVDAILNRYPNLILFGSDLVLGCNASTQEKPTEEIVAHTLGFYAAHWRYFESSDRQIPYPGHPIQGRLLVDALGLPQGVLAKLYRDNARRLLWG